ncbi:MAG: ZIP family metal transporter, partial [Prevotellaceae bacterium]|nr:ZIP family metal transporter [Prevotellaceae bacterium]
MMVWIYSIISTVLVSLVSFVGIFLLSLREKTLRRVLILLICFAIGALLGNSFFDLIPATYSQISNPAFASALILGGFLLFLFIDQILHRKTQISVSQNIKSYGYLSLASDAIHNFTDGILIAIAWLTSPEMGLSVTVAVLVHEIPQEIGDFGILLKAGFSKRKALIFNFYVALTAIVGTVLTLLVGQSVQSFSNYIIPLAAGGFIYIAAVNLTPEIVRSCTRRN